MDITERATIMKNIMECATLAKNSMERETVMMNITERAATMTYIKDVPYGLNSASRIKLRRICAT